MAKQDDYTRYTIRLPTPLYERVKAAAGEKSVNAEIVATLEREYPAPASGPDLMGWVVQVLKAPPSQRRALLDQANEELLDTGMMLEFKGTDPIPGAITILPRGTKP